MRVGQVSCQLSAFSFQLSAFSFQLSAFSFQPEPSVAKTAKILGTKDFHELKVWQKAHQLVLAVYQVTAGFPREERYGLISQLRRCSSSIPANLAEGCGRNTDAEFARFCSIAMGSASELEYHLLLARDLKLIEPGDHDRLSHDAIELKRMLTALRQKLTADR